jgi:hypothetical protein
MDETVFPPPKLTPEVVSKAPSANNQRRLSPEVVEEIWHAWRATNNISALAVKFGVSRQTIHNLVLRGLPSQDIPSFLERRKAEVAGTVVQSPAGRRAVDAAKKDVEERRALKTRATDRVFVKAVETWDQAFEETHQVVSGLKSLIRVCLGHIKTAARGAKLGRLEVWRDREGMVHYEVLPATYDEIVAATRDLSVAVENLRKIEAFLFDKPTAHLKVEGAPFQPGWLTLTEEQIAAIEETGQLPDGFSFEALFGQRRQIEAKK